LAAKRTNLRAFRFINKGVANLTIDAAYLKKINRVFGEDSPQGVYDSQSYLATSATKLTRANSRYSATC